jgi:arabinofuranosyltransferase
VDAQLTSLFIATYNTAVFRAIFESYGAYARRILPESPSILGMLIRIGRAMSSSEITTQANDELDVLPERLRKLISWRSALRFVITLAVTTVAYWEATYIAWVGDDAAITLRTVMNFVYGYGPVYNVGERVQAFTHPLWFLLVSLATYLYPHVLQVTFAISIGLSVLFMFLLTQGICTTWLSSLLAASILLMCKSYVDFSASGLENPLSNLLLLLFVLAAHRCLKVKSTSSLGMVAFVASLLYLTRADLIVLVAPLGGFLLLHVKPPRGQLLKAACIAATPVVGWTIFSIVYYGFPFPNTAYAKLGTGTTIWENTIQGWRYLQESFSVDPVTLMTVLAGGIAGIISAGPNRMLGVGVLLYLLYILRISGDFMSGRFLVAPLVVSIIILARKPRAFSFVGIGLALCGAVNIRPAILEQRATFSWDKNGIADERRIYWPARSLGRMQSSHHIPDFNKRWISFEPQRMGTLSKTCGGLGYTGLEGGPQLHIIDICGLSDPLLARLPSRPRQRVGHWERNLPTNYEMSVYDDFNHLVDEDVRSYYEKIRLVTRGPLFTAERWKAIYQLNFGAKPDLSRWSTYSPKRNDGVSDRVVPITRLRPTAREAGACGELGTIIFGQHLGDTVEVKLSQKEAIDFIDISINGNERFQIEYFNGASYAPLFEIGPRTSPSMQSFMIPPYGPLRPGEDCLVRYKRLIDEPKPITDRIRIVALDGNKTLSIGHLLVR